METITKTTFKQAAKKRVTIIQRFYGRKALTARAVYRRVYKAAVRHEGLAVIRLGDVMAKLLSNEDVTSLGSVAKFLGLPTSIPRKLYAEVREAALTSTVVGLSHFPASRRRLARFMKQESWRPPYITDSFINDQLYYLGYIHALLTRFRVVLVGRAANRAKQQLSNEGCYPVLTLNLESYTDLDPCLRQLKRSREQWDLVLVGASVPGRILVSRIARQLNAPGIEIGHIMDALAEPNNWEKPGNRMKFKRRWLRENATRGGEG